MLTIPDGILIVGEYKHESTQKTSIQNATVQSTQKEPKPHEPSADLITHDPSVRMDLSTNRVSVDDICICRWDHTDKPLSICYTEVVSHVVIHDGIDST